MRSFKATIITTKKGKNFGYVLSGKAKTPSEFLDSIGDILMNEGHQVVMMKMKER